MLKYIILAVVFSTADASGSYVVIAPAKVRSNMDLSLSVNIFNATSDVTVVASLLQEKKSVASATKIFQPGAHDTVTMKLPADLPSSTYTLNVKGSGGLTFENSEILEYNSKEASVFIQISKSIFKPGDTVNFRVFGVYSDLKSYKEPINIYIYDANSNKIKQWIKVTPTNGVITQELTLSNQPVLGDWKIQVEAGNTEAEKSFTVAEYVLPKFEVEVVMPSYALTTESDVTVTVKAKYTYGKPVDGTADVLVKLHKDIYSDSDDYSEAVPVISLQVPIVGEAKVSIPVSLIKTFKTSLDKNVLIVIANVTESLTGDKMSDNGTVTLYDKGVKLEFPDFNSKRFKPGLQHIAYLKVSQPNGLPITNTTEKVKVSVSGRPFYRIPYWRRWYNRFDFGQYQYRTWPLLDTSFSIPSNGLVVIPIDIPAFFWLLNMRVTLQAKFQDVSEELEIIESQSPSNSFIQLSLNSSSVVVAGEVISFDVKSTNPMTNLFYQVLSRGVIVKTGTVDAKGQLVYQFSIPSDASMAPNARIVVYYVRDDGEIVTESISFDISGAFKNKVSLDINETNVEPGSNVTVTVRADPDSVAHLLAIDQSVLLIRGDNDVRETDVYAEIGQYDTISDFSNYYVGSDASDIFSSSGVVVLTDALVYQYTEDIDIDFRDRYEPLHKESFNPQSVSLLADESFIDRDRETSSFSRESSPPVETELKAPTRTRTVFSETFLWTDLDVGANGSASISAAVPDTITSWVASAFAINSDSGLGVAPTQARLTVFRPFFVNLNLPYSVTRGEHLALQANVFNYMTEDMQVRVTLAKSNSFFNIEVDVNGAQTMKQIDSVQDVLVPAGGAKSVYFPIVPTDLGKIDIEVKAQSTKAADAVRRQLLVEAEGVPKSYNIPVLIDLTEGKTSFSRSVDLSLPSNTVNGSTLTRISAVGDLMGPTIAGLDSLLQMPFGCGEQNMIGLAPDVYITDYLKSVKQLREDIKSKALGFMEMGYQQELTYKHPDGSFSAFGTRDVSGSMWLTAFVVKVFHQAKAHIYIDDNVLINAIQWMIRKQNDDGSFPEPGNIIHKDMQSQTGKGLGLTLYVLISLLENKDLVDTNGTVAMARNKALVYAEQEVAKTDDLYILTMGAYVFQLAGSSHVQSVLDKLERKATVKDGRKFWHQPEQPKTTNTWNYPNPTKAVDIEMTAYALLTYTARGDLFAGKGIMQWLTEQRNPWGGFSSTQDTVIALDALSEFAKKTYSDNFNVQITAQLNETTSYSFNIDKTNSLVLQSRETLDVPSQVKIDATGSGMALVQVSVFFNVETEIFKTTFNLTVELIEDTLNYLVLETCTKWLGNGPSSAMAIQEIGIPSWFEADMESFPKMDILKRIETENKKVILYFDQIGTVPVCLRFRIRRTGPIAKCQPSAIRVYDYYEPRNQVTVFYQSQTNKNSTLCDVCPECNNQC